MTELQVFLALATAQLIVVMSPGPDVAVIFRNGIRYGYAATVPVAWGIGTGILIHVMYSVLGLGLIIATNDIVFNICKLLGAGYLAYIAIMSWRSSTTPADLTEEGGVGHRQGGAGNRQGGAGHRQGGAGHRQAGDGKNAKQLATLSKWQAYRVGFLANALNVKATIFFLSVYILIAGESPILLQIAYGIYMALAASLLYTCMAWVVGSKLRVALLRNLNMWEKMTAVLLLSMAVLILLYNPPAI